ncbi:MAG: AIR synthase family protein [Anaerolineaceae bacterium]|nr:AIR synthase family protein [Anaerolineaceae bacterium]
MGMLNASDSLPLGKLPPDLLERLLKSAPVTDTRVLLGPGIGMDCAVLDLGNTLLAFKSDPITFATDEIGWYSVQICANDIATTGATPRWMLSTLLLPEGSTTEASVTEISEQLFRACQCLNISLIGGHTEITQGIDRPILMGTMIGEVTHSGLITPRGATTGDQILLTKGIPIEATAILAREAGDLLKEILSPEELRKAADFLYIPGIGISRDAYIAREAGNVTAMHDPTEGGLASALWELAQASQTSLAVDLNKVPIPEISDRICRHLGLDPMATIASGALLMTVSPNDTDQVIHALEAEGIECSQIGEVSIDGVGVWDVSSGERKELPRPQRDEIARFFQEILPRLRN